MAVRNLPELSVSIAFTDGDKLSYQLRPASVTIPQAYNMRPQVDATVRTLRIIADYLDALIRMDADPSARERLTAILREEQERESEHDDSRHEGVPIPAEPGRAARALRRRA